MCSRPFRRDGNEYGCGQCMPCRINRKRLWATRMTLESFMHSESSFVTLTYDQENTPKDGSLKPEHLRDFLKRLRRRLAPLSVRYFAVGEYGGTTHRPHYHLSIFGPCPPAYVQAAWGLGFTYSVPFTPQTAAYVCGYVTKGLTSADDERLQGRHPEFARMSLRPGIGATAMPQLARNVTSTIHVARKVSAEGDLPTELVLEGRPLPLGRYLARRLRAETGFAEVGVPAKRLLELELERAAIVSKFESVSVYVKSREAKRDLDAHSAKARVSIAASKRSL